MQNFYNAARRNDDAFIDDLTARGMAYVPFFPLGASGRYGVGTLRVCEITSCHARAGCACLASAALAKLPADSGNIVSRTSPRESLGRNDSDSG